MSSLNGCKAAFAQWYRWMQPPYIIGAPMRVLSGPELAVEISAAGGLGFIGPPLKMASLQTDLGKASELIAGSKLLSAHIGAADNSTLPIGIGYQTWNSDLKEALAVVEQHRPCAVWLFAPRHGQGELDEWTSAFRQALPHSQIWIQIGTLREAIDAAGSNAPPDVLVTQGAEAGGHGRASDGLGLMTLLPEVIDATRARNIPVIAAGGIADGRGVAAALALGATGAAMGTRFLASREARISRGYQNEVVRATDGATSTVRTQLYNHLRGTFGWPDLFAPRTVINRSWTDYQSGVPFEELQRLHDEAAKSGDAGWGPDGRLATYAGASVGLIHQVDKAATIVSRSREEAVGNLKNLANAMV